VIRRTFRTLDRADKDFDAAIDYYLMHAGEPVAERFVDAISAAYAMIRDNPEIGALRLGESIGRPALRTWAVRGFPYLVCYEVGPGSVDIWRVLHGQSDIPEHLFQSGD
jgi:toxin ParE1/3/4